MSKLKFFIVFALALLNSVIGMEFREESSEDIFNLPIIIKSYSSNDSYKDSYVSCGYFSSSSMDEIHKQKSSHSPHHIKNKKISKKNTLFLTVGNIVDPYKKQGKVQCSGKKATNETIYNAFEGINEEYPSIATLSKMDNLSLMSNPSLQGLRDRLLAVAGSLEPMSAVELWHIIKSEETPPIYGLVLANNDNTNKTIKFISIVPSEAVDSNNIKIEQTHLSFYASGYDPSKHSALTSLERIHLGRLYRAYILKINREEKKKGQKANHSTETYRITLPETCSDKTVFFNKFLQHNLLNLNVLNDQKVKFVQDLIQDINNWNFSRDIYEGTWLESLQNSTLGDGNNIEHKLRLIQEAFENANSEE